MNDITVKNAEKMYMSDTMSNYYFIIMLSNEIVTIDLPVRIVCTTQGLDDCTARLSRPVELEGQKAYNVWMYVWIIYSANKSCFELYNLVQHSISHRPPQCCVDNCLH